MEVFKDVKGYKGSYQVSNLGRVKSLNYRKTNKEKILKMSVAASGYHQLGLFKDGKRKTKTVHQLVAEAFLNHTPCGYKLVVNHIDLDKLNNKVSNLEIVTARENSNHKHLKSSSKYTGVAWHKRNKKWAAYIAINGKQKYLGYFTDEIEASNAYQLKLSEI